MGKAWERNVAAQAPVVVVSDFDRELMRVGLGLEFWLRGRPDSDARRSAEMRVAEMQRFASEGRGEVWRRELAEATRKVLVEAGYLPLRRVDDVLMGDVLRATVKEMFPCKESE